MLVLMSLNDSASLARGAAAIDKGSQSWSREFPETPISLNEGIELNL